jgi:tripartite-type tricarboxylate transporter receptor subunit TctC
MRRLLGILGGLTFAITGALAQAPYPNKPITLIVPFAAGGPSDSIARLVGKHMSETLGQQIIIENIGGAGGTLGATRVAKAAPDGYTILVHHLAITSGASLYSKLQYDTASAFTQLGLINAGPYVITGRLNFPANTAEELIAEIRKSPGKISMAHSGVGAGSHLCATLFTQAIGSEVNQIAYRGAAQSVQDLLAGHVDLLCEQTSSAFPHIEAKKAKAFAVTSLTPVAQLPNVPTLDKAGVKGFELTNWHGLYAPANLPPPIAATLSDALRKALNDATIAQRFVDLGMDLFPEAERTPAAHVAKFRAELARWADVVKKAGITPQ